MPWTFLTLLLTLSAAGQTPPPGPPGPSPAVAAPGTEGEVPKYTLNPGDSIEFKFSYNSDLNDRVTIRPDGFVSLPFIGDVAAAGKTPEDLSKAITAKYQGILKYPELIVVVREFSAQRIYIAGEVNTPGVLQIVGRLTLAQALLNAGGPKPSAKLDQILLLRYEGENRTTVQPVAVAEILKGTKPDLPLRAYDVVFVPRSKIAQVGLFVEQYVNALVPKALMFPYNINNVLSVRQ